MTVHLENTVAMRNRALPISIIAVVLLPLGMAATWLEKPSREVRYLSPGQNNVVISQVRPGGPNAPQAQDDFVELFNPTSAAIDITDWRIDSIDSKGAMQEQYRIVIPTSLEPGQHYLVAGDAYTGSGLTTAPDGIRFNYGGVPTDGGVALLLADGVTVVDKVGMNAVSAEGQPLQQLPGNTDESYQRKPGGSLGSCYDSDDNLFDFAHLSPSVPQNSNVVTRCAAPTDTPPSSETDTFTFSPTTTGTKTRTPTRTLTPTRTQTSTSIYTFTPNIPAHMVISEYRSRGLKGEADEFVELFNPTGAATNIGDWTVKYSSGCGSVVAVLAKIPTGTVVLAGQHYLLASSTSSSITNADLTFTPGLTDDGGVALLTDSNQLQDQVGNCISTLYHEGGNLPVLVDDENQSYERKPGGATSCYDTNNNVGDFDLISPADPQNRSSGITLCGGVKTSTPTRTGTATRTITRTRAPTGIPDLVLINEFLPRPLADWNDDGLVNDGDEYIELVNRGTRTISLSGWRLDNGSDSIVYNLPKVNIDPDGILVFFHSETGLPLPDNGGTVRLVKTGAKTADIYRYGPVEVTDRTYCRLTDRNNGQLEFTCSPTPGQPNQPFTSAEITPAPTPSAPAAICPLPDTVPAGMAEPECYGFGNGIWNPFPEDLFMLPGRSKWSVFLE